MSKKTHILFFIGTMAGGGAERVLLELLKHLDRNKYKLSIAIHRPGGFFFDEIPVDVNVIDRSRMRKSGYNLSDRIFGLARVIRRENADIVFAFMFGAGRQLMRAALFTGRDVRFMVRIGENPAKREGKHTFWLWTILERWEVKARFSRADKIITSSEGVRDEFINQWKMREDLFEVIPNAVDTKFISDRKREEKDISFKSRKDEKIIVAVGRLVSEKGYDDMLRVFRAVRDQLSARLIILGQGPLHDRLVNRINELGLNDSVLMAGFVKNPWAWLNRADLYLSTSHSEGFHLTIVEAMACGVVPVATDCNYGPREIITDHVNGRLVPVGDIRVITSTVIELLRDDELRLGLRNNAMKRSEDFDSSRIVKEYENVFDGF